jgi:hypothetical protein
VGKPVEEASYLQRHGGLRAAGTVVARPVGLDTREQVCKLSRIQADLLAGDGKAVHEARYAVESPVAALVGAGTR